MQGIIEKWSIDAFNSNPGYGEFSLQRIIRDRNENEISNSYHALPNFNDESKYLVRVQGANDGTDKILTIDFSFHFEESISLDEITVEQGGGVFFMIYVC